MESQLTVRFSCENKEHKKIVRDIFSDNISISTEQLPGKYSEIYALLEEIHAPEEIKAAGGTNLEASWLAGGDCLSELQEIASHLESAGANKIVAYCWMDEEELVFCCRQYETSVVDDWQTIVEEVDLDLEGDSRGVSKLLTYIQKQCFD